MEIALSLFFAPLKSSGLCSFALSRPPRSFAPFAVFAMRAAVVASSSSTTRAGERALKQRGVQDREEEMKHCFFIPLASLR